MFRRLNKKYKNNGVLGIIISIVRRMPGVKCLFIYDVYRMKFDSFIYKSVSLNGINVVCADQGLVEELSRIQNKKKLFIERLSMGHFCFLAYKGNEPVAYLWCQQGHVHKEQIYGFEIPIRPNQVFYYDSYTLVEHRKIGLLRILIQKMVKFCENKLEKDEVIAIIESSNLVSKKAHEKIGFEKISKEVFLVVFGKRLNVILFKYN